MARMATSAEQPRTWPELFRGAIEQLGPRLSLVLDIADCRERWLQAEMYLHLRQFDPAFQVGHVAVGPNSKADFYGESPERMVAEVKLLGSGYKAKCFAGTGIIPECFSAAKSGARVRVQAEHLADATGYFLHDVNRLQSLNGDYARFVILVVDQRPPLDRLGRALLAVQLSDDEVTVESPAGDWIARIWAI
jgi:hypothetical protein